MSALTLWTLRHVLLPLLGWTTRRGGERAWRLWEALTRALSRLAGTLARFARRADEPPLAGLIRLTDWADASIRAEGEWVERGPRRAVKRIRACPLAAQLRATPGFCTRLGVVMGEAAFRAYASEMPVEYRIPQTLSQGEAFCEYVVEVG